MKPFLRFVVKGGSFVVERLKANVTLEDLKDAVALVNRCTGKKIIRVEYYAGDESNEKIFTHNNFNHRGGL